RRLGELRPAGDAEIGCALACRLLGAGGRLRPGECHQVGGRSRAILHERPARSLLAHGRRLHWFGSWSTRSLAPLPLLVDLEVLVTELDGADVEPGIPVDLPGEVE